MPDLETPDQKRCKYDNPETIYIEPICERCKHYAERAVWWDAEEDAGCVENDCPNKPIAYIRADLYEAQIAEMIDRLAENAAQFDDEQRLEIAILQGQNKRLKTEHERHIDEIVERAAEMDDELYLRIAILQSENEWLRAELDRLKAEIDAPRERRGFACD